LKGLTRLVIPFIVELTHFIAIDYEKMVCCRQLVEGDPARLNSTRLMMFYFGCLRFAGLIVRFIKWLARGFLSLRLSSDFHGITGPPPHYSMVHLTGLPTSVYQLRRSRGAGKMKILPAVIAFVMIRWQSKKIVTVQSWGSAPNPGLLQRAGKI